MSKNNTERNAKTQAGVEFVDLLNRDIKDNPGSVQPVSRDLLRRIQIIRVQADANRRRELRKSKRD
jgi:antitoxin PrlF